MIDDDQLWKFHLANEPRARKSLKAWLGKKIAEENCLDRVDSPEKLETQRGKVEGLRLVLRELESTK